MTSKLQQLAEIEGFEDAYELLESVGHDSVNPGICINKECDYTTEVEPDCRNGYCEECGTQTVKALSVLFGVI